MSAPTTEGTTPFQEFLTWYQIVGDLKADSEAGPAPLIVLHGGPGATHDYLSPLAVLAGDGRAILFYDQLGNGRSTHLPSRGAEFWTAPLFVEELANLVGHLGIGRRYHVLGQSWGGFLAQEHALNQPPGLLSLVLSNSAASYQGFSLETGRLRSELPQDVQATLARHEMAGTTDDLEYASASEVFYHRHLCRLDPWPDGVRDGMAQIEADPTAYHTMNGPSEFHITGSAKEWTAEERLSQIAVPTLVLSGRFDEATPALQENLVQGISGSHQVIFELSSHMPFWEEPDAYMAVAGEWLRAHD